MQVLMCLPQYYAVEERDSENLYMDPNVPPDHDLSLIQHSKLVACYHDLGIEVMFIEPNVELPDMTFTANSALICGKNAVIANFKPARRRGESALYEAFYESLGYKVFVPPKNIYFEGAGDALVYQDKILLGSGFRSDKRIATWLETVMGREVISLELVRPRESGMIFYHLDTAILAFQKQEKFMLHREAFTKQSIKKLEYLGSIYFMTYQDTKLLALNAVVVERDDFSLNAQTSIPCRWSGVVVLSDVANNNIETAIKHIGYLPISLSLTEFLKAGGGPFCLTKILY